MNAHRACAVIVALIAALFVSAESGSAATEHYYKSSNALEGKWYSGGYVTSTRNVVVVEFSAGRAWAKVGSFSASSGGVGVIQTYSRRHAKVQCGWSNKYWSGKYGPISCHWRH